MQCGKLKCVPSLRLDPNAVQFINDSTLRVTLLNVTVDLTAQALSELVCPFYALSVVCFEVGIT